MNTTKQKRFSRRAMFAAGGVAAMGSAMASGAQEKASTTSPRKQVPAKGRSNPYEALGIKTIINATGTVTILGGSMMPPEVVQAWVAASRYFVNVPELQEKVGERLAKTLGVEAALVTTGAAGSMMLGTVAAVLKHKSELAKLIPNICNENLEVLMQKNHHSTYDRQMLNVGVKLVDVGNRADLESKINSRTVMMFFMNLADPDSGIKRAEWVEVARKHNIPTLVDAAADAPPVEHLSEYSKMGFDLVAFSGGKGLLGPNDTGLLLGRNDLIDLARQNTSPRGGIGRMLKVSREDMMACLAAVERYVRVDHQAEWREFERRIGVIEEALRSLPGIQMERFVPPVANHVPHLLISWDESRIKITRDQLTKELRDGDPPIAIGRVAGTGDKGTLISVFQLQKGETSIVARRIQQILKKASA